MRRRGTRERHERYRRDARFTRGNGADLTLYQEALEYERANGLTSARKSYYQCDTQMGDAPRALARNARSMREVATFEAKRSGTCGP